MGGNHAWLESFEMGSAAMAADGTLHDYLYLLHDPKISPATGQQDDGAYLVIDMNRLPAATSTATVTINLAS